jgi:hypothetical protein
VQTLEEAKNCLLVLGVDADTIVNNGKNPVPVLAFGSNVHGGRPIRTAVFYSVAYEVLEQLL